MFVKVSKSLEHKNKKNDLVLFHTIRFFNPQKNAQLLNLNSQFRSDDFNKFSWKDFR